MSVEIRSADIRGAQKAGQAQLLGLFAKSPKQRKAAEKLTDAHVGARLRMRRMEQRLSQTDLGKRIGITFQQVQKYEKGSNRMGASRLRQVSEILQVPVSFFFDGLAFDTEPKMPTLNELEIKAAMLIRGAPNDAKRRQMIAILRTLVGDKSEN